MNPRICAATVAFVLVTLAGCSGAPQSNLTPASGPRQTGVHAVRPASITRVRIQEFALPNGNSQPLGIAAGPDGSVWFTELVGNRIGRITYHGAITEFALPHGGSTPVNIVAGSDGNMWFTEGSGNRIGRITPQGAISEFSKGLRTGSSPNGITAGPRGTLWFSEQMGNRIGCLQLIAQ